MSDLIGKPSLIGGSISDELSSQRTAMSFERTAMSSDRTLMSVVRTALSLIGFGFTIFQFFHKLNESFLKQGLPSESPRRFGLALIVLGVTILFFGILNHRHEARDRRFRRHQLFDEGLIHRPEIVRANSAMIVAVLLFILGILAILRVALSVGPV